MTQSTPGRVLVGRYRLESVLARGGMATVWLGRDELLGRRVAVKTLHSELAADDATRARFRHEAIAAAGLSHPNIVATYDTGDDDGTSFIVMELVEGESLRQLLDRRGNLSPREAVGIAHQVALALEAAHRNGIVHRDIKPANVLVSRDGPIKVTDFGIAKAAGGADFTRTGTVVGTARYLSPEQVQGLRTDARTDVYALGLVLYEMLAGHPAYQGDNDMAMAIARLNGPPRPIASIRPDVEPALASVLDQALQPEPAHRIPSAAAFAVALERAIRAPAEPVPRATRSGPAGTVTPRANPPKSPPITRAAPTGGRPSTSAASRTGTRASPRRRPSRRQRVLRLIAFLLFLAALGTAAGLITARIVDNQDGGSSSGSAPASPTLHPPTAEVREPRGV